MIVLHFSLSYRSSPHATAERLSKLPLQMIDSLLCAIKVSYSGESLLGSHQIPQCRAPRVPGVQRLIRIRLLELHQLLPELATVPLSEPEGRENSLMLCQQLVLR